MSNAITIAPKKLPAELAAVFGGDRTADLISSSGGFPVISIRGSKFRVKVAGEEKPLINAETGDPMPSLELVLLDWQKGLSKIYYRKSYQEGDDSAPDCWSIDGEKPDPAAENKQSPSCAACPHNVWGSKISEQGNKTKACSDSKRVAVTFASNLHNEELGGPMLLRVPAASLKDLTAFARGMVAKGFNASTIVVRIGFDISTSFPKLTFKAVRPLNEDELYTVAELIHSEQVATIMQSAAVTPVMPVKPPAPRNVAVDTEFEVDPAPAPAVSVAVGKEEVEAEVEEKPAAKAKPAAKPATKAEAKKASGDDALAGVIAGLDDFLN